MQVTRIDDAQALRGTEALRLQRRSACRASTHPPAQNFSVGLSHFLPGGGCEMDATPLEKVYVVHRRRGHDRHRGGRGDARRGTTRSTSAPNEARSIENRTNMPASMIVVMPYPPGGAMTTGPSLFDVSGKSALVTGATGAFGKMAAQTLADAGAKLTLAGGGADALDQLGSELRERGAAVETVPRRADTEADAEAMVETAVSSHGGIDLVVTAAGVNKVALATEQSPEDWQTVMDANAKGTWLVCRAAGRRMIDAGTRGKFVLVSSTRSDLGHPAGYTAYCASKAAVNLTRSARLRVGEARHQRQRDRADRVPVAADRVDVRRRRDQAQTVRAGFLTRIPLGRLGEPEDFVGALLYFLLARLATSAPARSCTSTAATRRGDGQDRRCRRRPDGARDRPGVRGGRPFGRDHGSQCRRARHRARAGAPESRARGR